ncbi:hypothetical protein LXA43DRAFT_510406 [Ganoderma leucocontextum]|nr:hypothetical protein LXA43DRAFT_510406 [Ganoderma leucocontextum]
MPRTIFPYVRQYAVIQMDPVAMVQDLEDAVVIAEAQAMRPKKYLVFLSVLGASGDLPFPWDMACEYAADIVSRGPCRIHELRGLTAGDAVIPIHPNSYPERPSVHPIRPFPFPGCSHCLDCEVCIFVKQAPGGYDNDGAWKLSSHDIWVIWSTNTSDSNRIAVADRNKALSLAQETLPTEATASSAGALRLSAEETDEDTSDYEDDISDDDSDGDPYKDTFVPLVDLWLDIDQHFTASDDLPDIDDFFIERAEIKRWVALLSFHRSRSFYTPTAGSSKVPWNVPPRRKQRES